MAFHNVVLLFLVIFNRANIIRTQDNSQVDKRLLLDDPQTATSQLLSLQREIQTLQTKIAEFDVHQSQIQFLNAQVSQLQQENTALKQQISHGSSSNDVQILTNKVATLEALNLDQELPLLKSKVDSVVTENQNLLLHSGIINCIHVHVFRLSERQHLFYYNYRRKIQMHWLLKNCCSRMSKSMLSVMDNLIYIPSFALGYIKFIRVLHLYWCLD